MRDDEPDFRRNRFPLQGRSAMEGAAGGSLSRVVWAGAVVGVLLLLVPVTFFRVLGAVILAMAALALHRAREARMRGERLSAKVRDRDAREAGPHGSDPDDHPQRPR